MEITVKRAIIGVGALRDYYVKANEIKGIEEEFVLGMDKAFERVIDILNGNIPREVTDNTDMHGNAVKDTIFNNEKMADKEQGYWDAGKDTILWDADPNCKHKLKSASGGRIKCIKCSGWYCL